MISFSGSLKVFLLIESCDMRKGFNGLYGLVSNRFGADPRIGALYLFSNQRHAIYCSKGSMGYSRLIKKD